jgi:hypothetical protein
MSRQSDGWWLASDGKWYPPETAPATQVPDTDPAAAPFFGGTAPPSTAATASAYTGTAQLLTGAVAPGDHGAAGGLRSLRTPQGVVRPPAAVPTHAPTPTPRPEPASWAPPPPTEATALHATVPTRPKVPAWVAAPVPAGWAPPDAGFRASPVGFAKAGNSEWKGGRPGLIKSGNVGWSLLRTVAAAAVVGFAFVEWYRQLVIYTTPPITNTTHYHLLSSQFGEWRLAIPIMAAAVALLSLSAAVMWGRALYPRAVAVITRVLSLGILGVVISALILRIPKGAPSAAQIAAMNPPPPASGSDGVVSPVQVVYSWHLSWGGWAALLAAIVLLLLSLPIAQRMR